MKQGYLGHHRDYSKYGLDSVQPGTDSTQRRRQTARRPPAAHASAVFSVSAAAAICIEARAIAYITDIIASCPIASSRAVLASCPTAGSLAVHFLGGGTCCHFLKHEGNQQRTKKSRIRHFVPVSM